VNGDWRTHIHFDPVRRLGKPVIKGTRLAMEFILGLFAADWSEQQVLESYPTLTSEALRAVFSFSSRMFTRAGPPTRAHLCA